MNVTDANSRLSASYLSLAGKTGQLGAAALSCQTTGFIRRGLRYAGYAEDEEGSMRKALRGRQLSPEKRAALPSQSQACSSMLCLSGKEVIYELTWLMDSHNTEQGAHIIQMRAQQQTDQKV